MGPPRRPRHARNRMKLRIGSVLLLLMACAYGCADRDSTRRPPPNPPADTTRMGKSPATTGAGRSTPVPKKPAPPPQDLCLPGEESRNYLGIRRVALPAFSVTVCVRFKKDLLWNDPKPPLLNVLNKWLPAGQRGDAVAQLRVARVLFLCQNVPSTADELEKQVLQMRKTGRDPILNMSVGNGKVVTKKEYAAEEQSMREEFAACRGVDADQRLRSREWARKASQAGLMDAQEVLRVFHHPGRLYYSARSAPAEVNKRDTADFAEAVSATVAALDAGSGKALADLVSIYAANHAEDTSWERSYYDPLKAYAFSLAASDLLKAIGEPYQWADVSGRAVATRLSREQRAEAKIMARKLLANPRCCVMTAKQGDEW